MGLVDLVKQRVVGRPPGDPERMRRSRPTRSPAVTSSPGDDGAVLLEIPLELQGKGLVAVLAKWAKAPQTRKFELEQVGAFVWEQCDGKQTFETISKKLRDRFKMNRLEADAALAAFLQMLSQRGLILLTVAKDK